MRCDQGLGLGVRLQCHAQRGSRALPGVIVRRGTNAAKAKDDAVASDCAAQHFG